MCNLGRQPLKFQYCIQEVLGPKIQTVWNRLHCAFYSARARFRSLQTAQRKGLAPHKFKAGPPHFKKSLAWGTGSGVDIYISFVCWSLACKLGHLFCICHGSVYSQKYNELLKQSLTVDIFPSFLALICLCQYQIVTRATAISNTNILVRSNIECRTKPTKHTWASAVYAIVICPYVHHKSVFY